MLFHNPSFLPPVRKSYFERAATKTRLNQFREGTPARVPRVLALCPAFIAMYQGALTWTRAVLATWPTCASCIDWFPNNMPTINPARIVRRIYSNHADYEKDHNNASERNRKVYIHSSGLARRTCGWSTGTRSKASGKTAVWAGSSQARFLCQSRLVQIYIGCDEIAIARRSEEPH